MNCLFVTDLHGDEQRYRKLIGAIRADTPKAVFLGGDLLPSGFGAKSAHADFLKDFLAVRLSDLKREMGAEYPKLFMILGDDDPRVKEKLVGDLQNSGLWSYVHRKVVEFGTFSVLGYAHSPPTPFLLKDWERYDVSRYVDPGSVSPEEGLRTVDVPENEKRHRTIEKDLRDLSAVCEMSRAICLFHSPPHETNLDRAALDGKMIDHVPLDVHVGSIAIRRFIEEHQPLLTLHGHIHESTRITGQWRDRIGNTRLFGGAHDGPELALVRFDLENLEDATRELV